MNKSIWKYTLKRERVLCVSEDKILSTPVMVADFLKAIDFQNQEQEHLISIILDSKNKIKGFYTVTIGTVDYAPAHAREVFRLAIMSGATKILLAHNHPSGSVEPSGDDIRLTTKMKEAGEIVGISILDHIIVGENGYFSFNEKQIL